MIHIDLFSGIGGFAYAADCVFENVTHVFCDNDKFCQAVLKKHWPESEIYDDIRSITDTEGQRWKSRLSKRAGPGLRSRSERRAEVSILTGGFPCQPFSAVGLRRGTADERHLWPEMLRVIRLTKPEWVIAENVRGITNWNDGVVFEQVCTDLEATGYEVQPFIIPAVAVNAPHRRDRVWFIANAKDEQRSGRMGLQRQPDEKDTKSSISGKGSVGPYDNWGNWEEDWFEIAPGLCGVDDGLSTQLGRSKRQVVHVAQARPAEQIKAYGNAIVPQVAMRIMEAIKISEGNTQ